MACPECEAQKLIYGFALEKNGEYMTKVPEVKKCCAVKVKVYDYDSLTVYFTCNGKQYTMNKKEFMKSSWRVYDSF